MHTSTYVVYRHTSKTSGKSYIGKSENGIHNRWTKHILDATQYRTNCHFHRAIRKYGVDDFTHDVLYVGFDKHIIRYVESQLIEEYDTYNTGYNMTKGGDGVFGYTHSSESKTKISRALSNKPKSTSHKEMLSAARIGKSPWNKGGNHTQKSINAMRINSSKPTVAISPLGERHDVLGMEHFCNQHNLSPTKAKSYMNKGKIPPIAPHTRRKTQPAINLTGWEFIRG